MEEIKLGAVETQFAEIIWQHEPLPDVSFPLEVDYLTLHQAMECINYARSSIARNNAIIPNEAQTHSVYEYDYCGYSTGFCTYFGNGTTCTEWKKDPSHTLPFHSSDAEFFSCTPRLAWCISVACPNSETVSTETIYVDAQTGNMYNSSKNGGYFPSLYPDRSEYARQLPVSSEIVRDYCYEEDHHHTNHAEVSADTLVKIRDYIPSAFVDLKYATSNNFTGEVIYDFSEPSLRYGTVIKLARVQQELAVMGYSLKIRDAYRPLSAQQKLWDICPDPKYVSNPATGNLSHCRGGAVDVTIVRADGSELLMPSVFDDFSARADRDYSDVSGTAAQNSQLLEVVMEKHGFKGYSGEWWHYSDTTGYEIVDQ